MPRSEAEMIEAPASAMSTSWKTSLAVSGLCIASFLAALDGTIVTTALPAIVQDLEATDSEYAWVGSAYLLAQAAFMPVFAHLSDIFGRTTILLAANTLFFIGSVVAAASPNIGALLGGRVVQGLGGGGVNVLVNICIADLFVERQRVMYFGILGACWAIAAAAGPVLGGVFADRATWRLCFWINLPCSFIAGILIAVYLRLPRPRTGFRQGLSCIDWPGLITVATGSVLLLGGLGLGGSEHAWDSAAVLAPVILGVAFLVCFCLTQSHGTSHEQLLPLAIFKDTSNLAVLGVCLSHGFCYIACAYLLPLYFQLVLGASAIMSGVLILPIALSTTLSALMGGIVLKRTAQYQPLIWSSGSLMCLGCGVLITLPARENLLHIVTCQIVVGLGLGPLFHAPLIALQANVDHHDIARASGAFSFTRMMSSAISVVIGQVALQGFLQHAGLPGSVADTTQSAFISHAGILYSLPKDTRRVVRVALCRALGHVWMIYLGVAGVGLLCSAGIRQRKALSSKPV